MRYYALENSAKPYNYWALKLLKSLQLRYLHGLKKNYGTVFKDRDSKSVRAFGGGMIVRTVGAFDSRMVALRAQLINQ